MNNININAVFQTGMYAPAVLAKIVEINRKITSLYFYPYKPRRNLKEGRAHWPIPMSRLLYHDASVKKLKLRREEITWDKIWSTIGLLENHYVLGVLSEVQAGKKRLHIPMMDFDDNNNLAQIECFLRAIGQKGVVLESGRSYHFYGIKLMDDRQWLKFMGDCLLSGLVEPRYLGHRLKDELCILRVSACPLRPKVPTVVSIVTKEIPKNAALMVIK